VSPAAAQGVGGSNLTLESNGLHAIFGGMVDEGPTKADVGQQAPFGRASLSSGAFLLPWEESCEPRLCLPTVASHCS
jgi:hypothetical protein